MGFSCSNKNDKLNVLPQTIVDTEFLRDIGLSNINNVKTNVIVCPEIFHSPEFYVNGATELVSGLTSTLTGCTTGTTAVYNLTYTPNFNVDFVITGGTDYTGYTGNFCYKVFSDNQFNVDGPFRSLVNGSEFINNCFAFSAITSTTLTQQFSNSNLSTTWGQYMVRPYYTFITQECVTGMEFNSWDSMVQVNTFNPESDFYFITVVDPPTPKLQGPSVTPPIPGFISDVILFNGVTTNPTGPQAINNELNYFNLIAVPSNIDSVIVFVNGVAITPQLDYKLYNYGGAYVPPTLVFQGVEIKSTDWIVAYYPTGPQPTNFNSNGWSVESFLVNTSNFVVNIGDPGLGSNYVNFNTITGKQEIYTKADIVQNDTPILFINGTQLAYGHQYFLSSTQPNRIILNEELIHVGDIVSIFYDAFILETSDYGSLSEPRITISWFVPGALPSNVVGEFIVNVYDDDDIFNTILYQQKVDFTSNLGNYSVTIDNLSLNIDYRFEIIYRTVYTAYMNNEIITCSRVEGHFNTKGPIINNTY